MKIPAFVLASAFIISSCNHPAEKADNAPKDSTQEQRTEKVPIVDKVLTAEEQAKLTPDNVIQMLKDGNNSFVNDNLTTRLHSSQVRAAAKGQYPKAVILSCLDSRIPVEDVFNKGIGDVFVARVAGNIVNADILGSMEYGCKVSGAKLILVLGHTECGAVKAAIDNVQLGNITELLTKIRPAVDSTQSFSGEKTSKDKAYVDAVAKENVQLTINNIRKGSPILKDMEKNGEIKIIGAIYDMSTGSVTFME